MKISHPYVVPDVCLSSVEHKKRHNIKVEDFSGSVLSYGKKVKQCHFFLQKKEVFNF